MPIRRKLERDYARFRPGARFSLLRALVSAQFNPGFKAVIFFRFQEHFSQRGQWRLAGVLRSWCLSETGADFVPGCAADGGLVIQHPAGIVLGAGTRIGADVTILQQVTLGERYADGTGDHAYPSIGSHCVIGAGAKILGGVSVGREVSIGANSVVLSDLADFTVAVGAPARVVRARTEFGEHA